MDKITIYKINQLAMVESVFSVVICTAMPFLEPPVEAQLHKLRETQPSTHCRPSRARSRGVHSPLGAEPTRRTCAGLPDPGSHTHPHPHVSWGRGGCAAMGCSTLPAGLRASFPLALPLFLPRGPPRTPCNYPHPAWQGLRRERPPLGQQHPLS